jgi:hypothetical protein
MTLAAEYQRSPWLAALPKEVERLNAVVQRADSAAEHTESVTALAERRIKTVCRVSCLAAIIMSIVTLGAAVWTLSDLLGQQARLEQRNAELAAAVTTAEQTENSLAEEITRQNVEIEKLSTTAELLKRETGGLDVVDNGDDSWEIAFPARAEFGRRPWWNLNGKYTVPFSIPGK